jgi:hypothetical protein
MTSYSNDPIRCKLTLDDVWNMCLTKGIDGTFHPVPETNETEFYVKFSCSDTDPNDPIQEKYKEDLEREFEKLHITQDHVREFGAHRHFNSKKSKVLETVLDEKTFGKENRYDILLDKAQEVHRLRDGRLFGIIENS